MVCMDLFEELENLLKALKQSEIEFALCGGLAMAVYAFPRATMDIDLIIREESLSDVIHIAKELGFNIDSGKMKFKKGAIQIYRMCKIATGTEEPLPLGLLIVTPEIEDVWESRLEVQWQAGSLPVVSPRGLIQLKLLRNSGQDQDDIRQLKGIIHES